MGQVIRGDIAETTDVMVPAEKPSEKKAEDKTDDKQPSAEQPKKP